MAIALQAQLSDAERRALDRAIAQLSEELGDDLLAVWLYGSRARGDSIDESDIDLMVVAHEPDRERVWEIFVEAGTEQAIWAYFSIHIETPESLADQRAIDSFFIRAVERDRLVLAGGEIPGLDDLTGRARERDAAVPDSVKPRTRQLIEKSRRSLGAVGTIQEVDADIAVSAAYYAMIYAARAALSEADVDARRHRGIWGAFGKSFVLSGRFDRELARRGTETQKLREKVDYGAETLPREQVERALADARRFVAEVERLLGV